MAKSVMEKAAEIAAEMQQDKETAGIVAAAVAELLTPALADTIAAGVIDKLGGAVVPAVIPDPVGAELRGQATYAWSWRQTMGMGHHVLGSHYQLLGDGSLMIELDFDGYGVFWRGVLRPVSRETIGG